MVLALACVGAGLAVLRCRKADWGACPPAIYLIACSGSPAQDEGHIKWPSLRAELAINQIYCGRARGPLGFGARHTGLGYLNKYGEGPFRGLLCLEEFAYSVDFGF